MSGLGAPLNALKPLLERYEVDEQGCWLWTAATDQDGYGVFRLSGKDFKAHRHFFEHHTSTRIPPGMVIDHLCNRKRCVNPSHMRVTTHRENLLRSPHNPTAINARKTECKNGHPFSGDNLYINSRGERVCRTCNRINSRLKARARYARQYAAYYTRYLAIVDEGR